jgi:endoglucanase Acf2
MRRASTRRGLIVAGTALLGSVAGCQGLLGGNDDGTSTADGDDGDAGDGDANGDSANGTPTAENEGSTASDETVSAGAGSFLGSVPDGKPVPPDDFDVAEGVDGPYPSNDWWTTLLWGDHGARLWSHPLVTDPGSDGVAVGAPREWAFTDAGPAGPNFAHLPWRRDLVVGPTGGAGADRTLVTGWGDWSVDYRLDGIGVEVTQVRGSPYLFCTTEGDGGVSIAAGAGGGDVSVFAEDGPSLGVTVDGRPYGLYAPSGSAWERNDDTFTNDFAGDAGNGYCTVAALPDADTETLAAYGEYAHSHVTDTRVEWTYDPAESAVRTTYRFETDAKEGDSATITALYPHQHRNTDAPLREETFVSPRGTMRPVAGESFETTLTYQGILPVLPGDGEETADLLSEASTDVDPGPSSPSDGVYWRGKNFTRLTAVVNTAEQVGDTGVAETALASMREELTRWLSADRDEGGTGDGEPATEQVFAYNDTWGTLQAYPAGFGAAESLNDHHFHYGQFVRGAAAVARRDEEWADDYGAMVEHLVRDYANPARDDDRYPFLRNFDPYAGHSWAGGAGGNSGNNQESSSEAVLAYAAMIYWGEYTGNEHLRDAGVYLYTHETTAAREYWFDERDANLPEVAGYDYDFAAQVWGSGVHWMTWWTEEPEAIYLINALPVGGHSLYLGLDEAAAGATYEELLATDDAPYDYWPAILAKYRALSAPADALDRWAEYPGGEPEMGTSRAHANHWIHALDALGSPDPEVTADHTLAAVFERDGGRTYVADNPGEDPVEVTFSDGTALTVPPGTLGTR